MKRKEILAAILANPGKPLYAHHGAGFITLFEPISKTNALKVAAFVRSIKTGTYISFRPDLERYRERKPDFGSEQILLFDCLVTEEVAAERAARPRPVSSKKISGQETE